MNEQSLAVEVMPYIFSTLGVMALVILNGIKSEIKDIKLALNGVEKDLREGINSLDHRVAVIETRCAVVHK